MAVRSDGYPFLARRNERVTMLSMKDLCSHGLCAINRVGLPV